MFNLLVADEKGLFEGPAINWPKSTFLALTSDGIRQRALRGANSLETALKRMPVLMMYTAHIGGYLRVGWLTSVISGEGSVRCTVSVAKDIKPISRDEAGPLMSTLMITPAEATSAAWSIKPVDLPDVLVRYRHLAYESHRDYWDNLARIQRGQPVRETPPSGRKPIIEAVGSSNRQTEQRLTSIREPTPAHLKAALTAVQASVPVSDKPHAQAVQPAAKRPQAGDNKARIFIVHGHDDAFKNEVAKFIRRLGMEPIILHEQANRGRTIIAKFEHEANYVRFAVVLITPDDVGRAKSAKRNQQRPRQNVVFELGFFFAKLGGQGVAALVKDAVETPSDFDGVVYIPANDKSWKAALTRELKAAHIPGNYGASKRGAQRPFSR